MPLAELGCQHDGYSYREYKMHETLLDTEDSCLVNMECWFWPCFGTAGCGWAVDARSLRIHTLPNWVFLWRSTLLFITGTHKHTMNINTMWGESKHPPCPQKHRTEWDVNSDACSTDWQSALKQKDGRVEMRKCEQYVGTASKCTANGESLDCFATKLCLSFSYRARKQ